MWGWMGHGGFGGGFGMFGMALVWLVFAVLLVWVIRVVWDRPPAREGPRGHAETPLEILQRRYARGEIDKTEFEEKRRDLS